ncbi:peptidase [Dyadobacter frigoris]|uniref:Peptidase n=1 Tax=Dyadobacter frigoris TaxID=2576211 RepID=A0A4U6D9Y6_9BACT|nr:peptidase [Dyadobacter frigoris]TKT93495.1 peptidase [Dyadobacter frigoris]GLU55778.1 hypothetical protein Dfri01_52390 [Dyadobacter frigoris]
MNPKTLVRLSNIIGTIAITLLIYWVFIFISYQVFGLKLFREKITETFFTSIIGILALMFGALITNLMFNLTRIAEKHNLDEINPTKTASKQLKWLLALTFPVILGLLFFGDYLTSENKEKLLIQSAQSIINDNSKKADKLVNYSFDKKWIMETEHILDLLSKTDKNFPSITVIVSDSIDNSRVLLGFRNFQPVNDTLPPSRMTYIQATTKEEREYLYKVFEKGSKDIKFSAENGQYQLFYPYFSNNKKIVIYFSDYQRYGIK